MLWQATFGPPALSLAGFSLYVDDDFRLPGCNPPQLHQAQAHLPRLLVKDFTQTTHDKQRGRGGAEIWIKKEKQKQVIHLKRKMFPEIKFYL